MRGRRAVISQTSHRRQGFILLPVALVAVLAFLMNRESGMGMALVAQQIPGPQEVANRGVSGDGGFANMGGVGARIFDRILDTPFGSIFFVTCRLAVRMLGPHESAS
jgi:hypothetical protein